MDDLERLLHPGDPLLVTRKLVTERTFVDVLPGAHPEHESARGEPGNGGSCLGDQGRVVVKQRTGDRGQIGETLRPSGGRSQPAPDKAGRRLIVDPGMEMVGGGDGVEAGLVGGYDLVDQDFRLIGLVGGEPGKLGHQVTLGNGARGSTRPLGAPPVPVPSHPSARRAWVVRWRARARP